MVSVFGEWFRLLVHLKSGCFLEALLRVGWPGQEGRWLGPQEDLQRASRIFHVSGEYSKCLFCTWLVFLLCREVRACGAECAFYRTGSPLQ